MPSQAQSHADLVERYYRRNRQLIAACDIVHAFISKEEGLTGVTKYGLDHRFGRLPTTPTEIAGVQGFWE